MPKSEWGWECANTSPFPPHESSHRRQRCSGFPDLGEDHVAIDVPGGALVPHLPPAGKPNQKGSVRRRLQ